MEQKTKINGFRLDVSKILLPTRVYDIESASDQDIERERTTPLLPPSGKFLHGYPITNIRLVEAFMNTKKFQHSLQLFQLINFHYSTYTQH